MTERAQRAARVLESYGWSVEDDTTHVKCANCSCTISSSARFCQHCGTKCAAFVSAGAIAELEEAIAAAVDDQRPKLTLAKLATMAGVEVDRFQDSWRWSFVDDAAYGYRTRAEAYKDWIKSVLGSEAGQALIDLLETK